MFCACFQQGKSRGKTVANLEPKVFLDVLPVAQANGNDALFKPHNMMA